MTANRPLRWCYWLLIASIPASMLLIFWVPVGILPGLMEQGRMFLPDLVYYLQPLFPSWPQYFGVQTLVAAMAVCAALWLFGTLGTASGSTAGRRAIFPALVAAYAAWAALGWLWSAWPYATRATVIRELPFYALCIAAYALCARPRRWLAVARVFVVSISLAAAFQAAVFIGTALVSRRPELKMSLFGLDAQTWDSLSLAEAFRHQAVVFANPNFGCALLLTGMLLCAALLVRHLRRARRGGDGADGTRLRPAFVVAGLAALGVLGLVFVTANALAGWVAGVVALGAYLIALLPWSRARRWIVVAILFVTGMGMMAVLSSDRLWTRTMRTVLSPRRTTSVRAVDWLAATALYVRRPVRGWGMGTFSATHARFHPPLARKISFTASTRTTHPHSEFFRLAAEQGSVGLLLYLAVLGYAFAACYVKLRRRPFEQQLIGYALWAGVITFVVQGAFGKAPANWSFSANFWLLLGVVASAVRWPARDEPEPDEASEGAPLRLHAPALLAVLVVAALVAWGWWEWAVGAYRSKIFLYRARGAQRRLGVPGQGRASLEEFSWNLERARDRCLWPDEVLHMDYAIGWFLAETGSREARLHGDTRLCEAALAGLQQVQQIAPEFLDTRYLMALCYVELKRPGQAVEHLIEFLERNPYIADPSASPQANRRSEIVSQAYSLLASIRMDLATHMLEEHVLSRLEQPEGWLVEDYPTASEVRKLLHFYFLDGQWDRARSMVERVDGFFDSARLDHPRLRVDALGQVRRLAGAYRLSRQESHRRLHEAVRQRFPDAWKQPGK